MIPRSLERRGLKRPRIAPELDGRVPPGQHPTRRWPVLHHGDVPVFDPQTWDLRLNGRIEKPVRLDWEAVLALPRITVNADLHCVTRWSALDNTWEGVAAREILSLVRLKSGAAFVLFHAEGGYTANLPLSAFADDDVLLAIKHNGEALTPEHGAPLRAIIPKRYAWKGPKWLRRIEFLAEDQPGFWEQYGYHNDADPWREERFAE